MSIRQRHENAGWMIIGLENLTPLGLLVAGEITVITHYDSVMDRKLGSEYIIRTPYNGRDTRTVVDRSEVTSITVTTQEAVIKWIANQAAQNEGVRLILENGIEESKVE